ncbi:DUF979 domain-containing protein [Rhizorhabdus dicambivorans]|uniref:DUF979 domain-containing protein n=1 Tax=Rhizorhabdus dicambivorans TaxID=1850238 RepID=A0A2A4FWM1_9SPHN|nr:DUF979 domain-containing protein [Rhizorhabdus dicambivorans]ATE63020.1 DUF979 domain-containing protein [Rhizorhabdus dicambivorans]PCE43196.1 DUF979 domain-containing protein [Rhizorhabdus dicambivorans]
MIGLNLVYPFAGLVFLAFAWSALRDRSNAKRIGNALFYALIALSLIAGDRLGDIGNGLLVLGLVAIAGLGRMGRGSGGTTSAEQRGAEAGRRGNRLFLMALLIPLTALAGTYVFKQMPTLIDGRQATLVALATGVILALLVGYAWFRPRWLAPFDEGRRLMDGVGWAAVLPQMLASLGAVFALAGVGDVVGGLMERMIPEGSLVGAVLAYGIGMALFTIVMGNAFAAFPVMAAAIGIPLLIHGAGGDPAVIAAIGMLAGFCGTLMTPMAANFNLVPAALLDLKDRHAVIRAQIPTALPLLAVNIALLWWLGFRA